MLALFSVTTERGRGTKDFQTEDIAKMFSMLRG